MYIRFGIHRYGILPKVLGGFLLLIGLWTISGALSEAIDGTVIAAGLTNVEIAIAYLIGGAMLIVLAPAFLLLIYFMGRVVAAKSPWNSVRGYHWMLVIIFALAGLNYLIESSIGKERFLAEYLDPALDTIIYGPLFFILGPLLVMLIVAKGMGGRMFNMR